MTRYLRAADDGPSDAELLRRFAETRDQAAFELLVWRHAGMVQAAAVAVLRDRHLAEDAAQATFLALARHAGRVRANPSGWLYRTARRAALALRRPVGPAVPDIPAPTVRHSRTYEDAAVLHDELARLPDRYRLPVLLCLVEGLTHPAAAARLGWPVGTVAGRLSRAKALLRDRLARRGVTAGLVAAPLTASGWVSATATAATAFAAGGPPSVAPSVLHLAKGLVPTMTVTKWATAAGLLAAATIGGGVWAGGQAPPQPAAPAAQQPAPRRADLADRKRSEANLKQIVLAMHMYHDVHGHLPADVYSADGKPLLSWRVGLLRLLEEAGQKQPDGTVLKAVPVWREFKMDEPWDGPTNKPLLARMPDVYRLASQPRAATDTYYQGLAGPGAFFEPGKRLELRSVTDGLSNTLAVAEVGPPVPWTKPSDVPYTPDGPLNLAWPFANVRNVAHADGQTHRYTPTVPADYLRQTITRSNGEVNTEEGKYVAKFPAETPEEKVELARLRAEVAAKLAEIGRRAAALDDLDEVEALRTRLGRTLPPADGK